MLECLNVDAISAAFEDLTLRIAFDVFVEPDRDLGRPLNVTDRGAITIFNQDELALHLLAGCDVDTLIIRRLRYYDVSRSEVITESIDDSFEPSIGTSLSEPLQRLPRMRKSEGLVADLFSGPRRSARRSSTATPGETHADPPPELEAHAPGDMEAHLHQYGLAVEDFLHSGDAGLLDIPGLVPESLEKDLRDLFEEIGSEDSEGDLHGDHDDVVSDTLLEDLGDLMDVAPLDGEVVDEPYPWNLITEAPPGTLNSKVTNRQIGRLHRMPHTKDLSWKATCQIPGHKSHACWITPRGDGDFTSKALELDLTKWIADGIGKNEFEHKQLAQNLKRTYGVRVASA